MGFSLGQASMLKLQTVDPKLQRVIMRAIDLTEQDFSVLEGVRTLARQYELYAQGRTIAECRAAGLPASVLAQPGKPKVTWTLQSKHFPPAGSTIGRAVDLGVYPYDPAAGPAIYKVIYAAVMAAAKEQNTRIRSGMDWNQNGHLCEPGETDLGHYELA